MQQASNKTILVIDDETDILDIFRMVLEIQGYHVVTASNGREALDALKDMPPPALIVVDLMMPVMDGRQFLEAIKGESRLQHTPIVVISAFLEKGAPIEATEFLRKPFDLDAVSLLAKKYCSIATPN
jgi:CheY-like chemotaxis protein